MLVAGKACVAGVSDQFVVVPHHICLINNVLNQWQQAQRGIFTVSFSAEVHLLQFVWLGFVIFG